MGARDEAGRKVIRVSNGQALGSLPGVSAAALEAIPRHRRTLLRDAWLRGSIATRYPWLAGAPPLDQCEISIVMGRRILRHLRCHSSYWVAPSAASMSACLVMGPRIRARAKAFRAMRGRIRNSGASFPRYALAHAPALARASAGGTRPSLGIDVPIRGKGLRIVAISPGMRGYGCIHCRSSMPICMAYRARIPSIRVPKSAHVHARAA